ncbi:hypothetical protein QO259_05695 [Salinicola sp. JS01]|uniref:hypothetical protein n=1 Tax=Salinicola sp. JS01 TaxID=3050071 RepID=UPI00255B8BB3|nr:hypothetical protein [Salinicola sp. JS01]WIX34156.1 hypothetical protein QO259_05695 [Salinicola sp. JS01]
MDAIPTVVVGICVAWRRGDEAMIEMLMAGGKKKKKVIFVGCLSGWIVKIDVDSQDVLWSVNAFSQTSEGVSDMVYDEGLGKIYALSSRFRFRSIDAETGEIVYFAGSNGVSENTYNSRLSLYGNNIYLGSYSDRFLKFNVSNWSEIFSANFGYGIVGITGDAYGFYTARIDGYISRYDGLGSIKKAVRASTIEAFSTLSVIPEFGFAYAVSDRSLFKYYYDPNNLILETKRSIDYGEVKQLIKSKTETALYGATFQQNQENCKLVKIDSDGNKLFSLGYECIGNITSVDTDDDGFVYTSDYSERAINVFDSSGAYIETILIDTSYQPSRIICA